MNNDLVIGFAANFQWAQIEPYAVSLVRSGFVGKKVLFAQNLADDAVARLNELGFEILAIPPINFSDAELVKNPFFAYVARFLLIHMYLYDNPGFRFVICSDTRDVVFQHNPILWLEQNIGDKKLVAAPEYILHQDQEGNTAWVNQGFLEIAPWMMPSMVYCSGFISGYADYISDLALAVYMTGRHLTGKIWGVDQPAYNMIMHQKAYEDVTLVPHMSDQYCLHMVVLAFEQYRKMMTELPPVAGFSLINCDAGYRLPDLSAFAVLHQYDRVPPLAEALRAEYTLANLHKPPTPFALSKF